MKWLLLGLCAVSPAFAETEAECVERVTVEFFEGVRDTVLERELYGDLGMSWRESVDLMLDSLETRVEICEVVSERTEA